jgi:hypothetical protein
VNFECADLGHGGQQLHPHVPLGAAGGCLHDGGDRRQTDEVLVVEGSDLAGQVAGVSHRRGEVKAHRLPQAQAEGALRQPDFVPFLGAARQHADALPPLPLLFENQEIAARRAAADALPVPLPDQRVGDRAARDGDIGIVVVQDAQGGAAPVAERGLQAFGERRGAKDAAVEQQRIRQRQLACAACSSPSAWRAACACRLRKAATWRVIAGSAG